MTEEKKLRKLISAMLDESISEEESKELDAMLLESKEAREIYRRLIDMHFTMTEDALEEPVVFPDLPPPEDFPDTFSSMKKKLIIFQVLAACLACMNTFLCVVICTHFLFLLS